MEYRVQGYAALQDASITLGAASVGTAMGNSSGRPRAAVNVQINIQPGQPVLPGMLLAGLVNATVLEPISDVTGLAISVRKHERSMTIIFARIIL